jgi:probable F420-dependent oxidoreductase
MKYGTSLPLVAAMDHAALRDFAQTLDGAGFDYLTVSGHLLSTEPGRFPDRPAMMYAGPFYEPLTLFAYLAATTERLRFRTSILLLPLLPTVLVARQAAELSLLSGGRFELGVAVGWNPLEYQAAGQDFHTRGRRLAEQIVVLRRLWTEPFVTFHGRWHTLEGVGLNRLPQAPIPIWMGGTDERALRRAARLADGWIPLGDPSEIMPRLRRYVADAGRDPSAFGLTARLTAGPDGPAAWVAEARRLVGVGATHLSIAAPPDLAPAQALARIVEARKTLAAELGG